MHNYIVRVSLSWMVLTDNPVGALQQYFLGFVPVAARHRTLESPVMSAIQVREDSVSVRQRSTPLLALWLLLRTLVTDWHIAAADGHQRADNA